MDRHHKQLVQTKLYNIEHYKCSHHQAFILYIFLVFKNKSVLLLFPLKAYLIIFRLSFSKFSLKRNMLKSRFHPFAEIIACNLCNLYSA